MRYGCRLSLPTKCTAACLRPGSNACLPTSSALRTRFGAHPVAVAAMDSGAAAVPS